MTALCNGGTSRPIPGTALLQNLTSAAIIELLITQGVNWLAPLAYGVGYLAYDLTGLCTTDPPAMPSFTADRVFSYTNPLNPQGAQFLREDVTALIANFLWRTYCQCDNAVTPPIVVVPTAPGGQQTNDPRNTKVLPSNCGQVGSVFEGGSFDSNGNHTATVQTGQAIPAAMQWLELGVHCAQNPNGVLPWDQPIDWTVEYRSATASLGRATFSVPANAPGPFVWFHDTTPPGTTAFRLTLSSPSSAGRTFNNVSAQFNAQCNTPPISAEQPCCPPDPTLVQLLIQIQNELALLATATRSNAYTRGTAHAGLQGSGTLSISSLRGVEALVTAGVPARIQIPGNPPYQWDLGFLSWFDGGGMLQQQRLTRQHQIWLPTSAEVGNGLGYFFNPGVTVTLTELVPA